MPRRPRVFVPGAIYHVYNRVSSGEPVFAADDEAELLMELIRGVKGRDGWMVYAWCIMSNHYHLVVRMSVTPLWRGLHRIQNAFSRSFNRRNGRTGPLWQSRYHAKLVADERYLGQLIVYVHMNPVRAGLVDDPAGYRFSGHRELLGRKGWDLVDVDQSLLCFGQTRKQARSGYRRIMAAAAREDAMVRDVEETEETAGQDGALWFPKDFPYLDALGRSSVPERRQVSAGTYLAEACEVMGISMERLAGRSKDRETVMARRLIATLGVERWGLGSGEMARELGKIVEVVSRWVSTGSRERVEDPGFRENYQRLDQALQVRRSTNELKEESPVCPPPRSRSLKS